MTRAITLILLALALRTTAEEARFDARALLERATTEHVVLSADGAAVELQRGVLYEDDGPAAGYSYKPNEEKLSATTWVRKELLIPDPRAARCTLLVGQGGKIEVAVNGASVALDRLPKVGNHWDALSIPPASLRPGKNEIVLRGPGKIWIARDDEYAAGSRTRTKHPNRSAKSTDGGKTWDYDRLGPDGTIDGEYCVRLFLDQHPPAGSLVLPVLDSGNLADRPVPPSITAPAPVTIRIDADPGVSARIRTGPTPTPDEAWSPWQALPASGTLDEPTGRYAQLTLDLKTADPLRSPRLRRVTIESTPGVAADWPASLRVLEHHNPPIVRSSIPFEYEPFDHPRLKQLRAQHKLDDVVAGAATEFETITRLAEWSSRQWTKGHLAQAYPPWDALEILKPHADGRPVGGFCHQYNLVFLQACESFGIPGRAVSLGPGPLLDKPRRGGHEVVELWSNDHAKWVYVDGQFAWYAVDAESATPLSLLDLRTRQLQVLRDQPTKPIRIVKIAERGTEDWPSLDEGIPFAELRLIPRSNFLEHAAPLPLNQGMRGWFWTGHHVWTDPALDATPLYTHRVATRANWDWTLNQARVTLEPTATPHQFRVHLDTVTPGFDTFLADVDGAGPKPVRSGFPWTLNPGRNRLEVRSRNTAGRTGPPGRIVIERP